MPTPLQVTALTWLLISAGHTLNGREWQSNAKFRALPDEVKACAKIGWYQGSGFLAISALLNHIWSKNPVLLHQAEHKGLAASIVAIFWISSYHYAKNGVTSNAIVTALGGALQVYAAGNW